MIVYVSEVFIVFKETKGSYNHTHFPIIFKRKLQNSMLKHANNITIRESMQNDVCKIVAKLQKMKEKKEAQLNNIDRLANMITMIEEEMVQLRKKYERAVQRRNER